MSYISTSDISDKIADSFDLSPYILEADQAIEDLAERVGVRDSGDIEVSPVHYKIRRYAIVYTLMRLCQDRIGSASTDVPEANKYLIQFEVYRKELAGLTDDITQQMFTGDVTAIRDRVASVEVWRG